jgi:diaminopimelate epimerase
LALNSTGSVQNSQCTLNSAGSSVTSSGNNLSWVVPLTFEAAFDGCKAISLYAAAGSLASSWVQTATWTVGTVAAEAPAVVSSTPSSGTGTSQTFTFLFSDPAGYATISEAMFDIYSTSGTGPQCLGYYNAAANAVYLMNDAQNAWLGPLALNSTGSVQNSQCILNSAGSSVTGSGNNLSWVVPLTFEAAFDGTKAISLYAASGSLTSSWIQAATWTVGTVAAEAPAVVSSTPSSGTGTSQTFTFLFSDPAGYATISEAMFDIYSTSGTGPQCLGYYNAAANAVYLMNDAQNAWLGPLALNSTGSVQNSQCILNSAGSSVTGSGNNLSWVVPLTFEAAFDGTKAISLYAASGSLTSSWVQAATWTVP